MIRSLVVQVLLLPLRFYKWALSPLLPPMCRFHPSCSVYAMGAIAVHGPFKGTWLAARRVTRCHPFNPGGFDPVPPRGGLSAEQVLASSEPEIVARLNAPPHPMLGLPLTPTLSPEGERETDRDR
jgi:putative membrane protein insertion efficiency factor